MSYVDVGSIGDRGRILDVEPLIAALRLQPADFEISRSWLRHVPSQHRFKVERDGRVTIDARCECSLQSVGREQARQLQGAITHWQQEYWRPRQINREFASHFKQPNAWVRLFRDVRMAWRRFRRVEAAETLPAESLAPQIVPAE